MRRSLRHPDRPHSKSRLRVAPTRVELERPGARKLAIPVASRRVTHRKRHFCITASETIESTATERSRCATRECSASSVSAIPTGADAWWRSWPTATFGCSRSKVSYSGTTSSIRRRNTRPRHGTSVRDVSRQRPPCLATSHACRRGDLNPYALAGTSPSSWRVCLFRHSDVDGAVKTATAGHGSAPPLTHCPVSGSMTPGWRRR